VAKTFSFAFDSVCMTNNLFTVTFAMVAREDRLAIGQEMFCSQFPLVSLLVNN
jgi:hypothetical protein